MFIFYGVIACIRLVINLIAIFVGVNAHAFLESIII